MANNTPADLARQTLKRLMELGLSPTPEHYSRYYHDIAGIPAAPEPHWGVILQRFFREWERSQSGLSHLQKLLDRDQILQERDSQEIANKLHALLQKWEKLPSRQTENVVDTPSLATNCEDWRQLCRNSLRHNVHINDEDAKILLNDIEQLLDQKDTTTQNVLPAAKALWKHTLEQTDKAEKIRQGLQQLLHHLLRNIADLVENDQFLSGQLDVVRQLTQHAENPQEIEQAIVGLKEIIFQQGKIQSDVSEARDAIRDLVNLVLDTIETMTGQSGRNHQHLEQLAGELETTNDWQQIRQIVAAVVDTSKIITAQSVETQKALIHAKNRLQTAQSKIRKLEEEMEVVSQLIHIDPLTGTLNRRGLTATFMRETARSQRFHHPLTVAIIDLDHFKKVNDVYGHDLGDVVLQSVARILRDTLRGSDIITRYGGEEFVILMPDTYPETALGILERVQERLAAHPFQTRDQSLFISFSGGISLWQEGQTMEQTIATADTALYQAKDAGRRRIHLASQANSSI